MEESCEWSVRAIAFAAFLGIGFVGAMGLYAGNPSTDRISDMTGTRPSATVTVTVNFCSMEPSPTSPSSPARLRVGEPVENQDGGESDWNAGIESWKKQSACHVEVNAATDAAMASSRSTPESAAILDYKSPTSTLPVRVQFTEDSKVGGTQKGGARRT